MSKEEKDNQHLRDLLNKSFKATQEGADEFEKAAAEGFAMFESEEEALELKRSLDKKIHAEVFNKPKKNSGRVYWLAAAGLTGVIGLVIYLFQTYLPAKPETLAIQEPPRKEQIEEKIKNETAIAEPIKPEEKSINKGGKIVDQANGPKENSRKFKSMEPTNSEGKAAAPQEDAMAFTNSASSAASPMSNVASNKNEGLSEVASFDAAAEAGVSSDDKKKDMEVAAESKSKKSRTASQKESQPAAAPQTARSSNVELETLSSEIQCTYKGGAETLQKELREKLSRKNLLTKFEAILYINTKGKVEQVKFINRYGMSSKDEKQVKATLLELDKFVVDGASDNNKLFEYRLEFKP